jgi:hypothetical protein
MDALYKLLVTKVSPEALALIAVVVIFCFVLDRWGKSRDDERKTAMETMTKMGEDFAQSLKTINDSRVDEQKTLLEAYREQTKCMQQIVDKCNRGQTPVT